MKEVELREVVILEPVQSTDKPIFTGGDLHAYIGADKYQVVDDLESVEWDEFYNEGTGQIEIRGSATFCIYEIDPLLKYGIKFGTPFDLLLYGLNKPLGTLCSEALWGIELISTKRGKSSNDLGLCMEITFKAKEYTPWRKRTIEETFKEHANIEDNGIGS